MGQSKNAARVFSMALTRSRPQTLAALAGKAGARVFARHGFTEHSVLTHWSSIVGTELAAYTLPARLRFPRGARNDGTLVVLVEGPAAIEIQHLAPRLIERVNGFLGYPAIRRLKIEQAVLPRRPPRQPSPPPLDETRRAEIAALVGDVEDPALRLGLARLGEAIARRKGVVQGTGKPPG